MFFVVQHMAPVYQNDILCAYPLAHNTMGHLENPWAKSAKQEQAINGPALTKNQILAHTPHETAENIEYDFSGAEAVFGGKDDDEESGPNRDEPAKH